YNDRVFDLFEPPEKRTPAGLPIRDNNGKSIVVGLTERPCTSLKDFESLYDQANVNRSTSATKLNAHSSRSHAVLCVKVTQVTGNEVRVSTASAIDLAGSEDNRRTDNGKERMVESASINKSLFVLAQCVEAISKKQNRIPYRESKMTRILSLGQNNGLTVMILNLAPVRSYHLDTLSSLNFANRTKKIEINEVENRPFFRTAPKPESKTGIPSIPLANRQPLRPKALSHNVVPSKEQAEKDKVEKPVKAFSVYSDKPKTAAISRPGHLSGQGHPRTAEAQKRTSSEAVPTINRPSKLLKSTVAARPEAMSQKSIEELIERKVAEKLAEQALSTKLPAGTEISPDVQARLIALERRVIDQESARAEGLQYLLMAKQHTVRGEEVSALKMYQLALPYFPDNQKLAQKMLKLQEKIERKEEQRRPKSSGGVPLLEDADEDYQPDTHDQDSQDESVFTKPSRSSRPPIRRNLSVFRDEASIAPPPSYPQHQNSDSEDELAQSLINTGPDQTPRSKHILRIINSRDVAQIRLLKGVGAKKAEMIVNALCEMDDEVRHVGELGRLKGVGVKGVERMREGLAGVMA
ncbi:kinesin-domain-containing protein, partial [Aureobasidium sp. EXF-8845]